MAAWDGASIPPESPDPNARAISAMGAAGAMVKSRHCGSCIEGGRRNVFPAAVMMPSCRVRLNHCDSMRLLSKALRGGRVERYGRPPSTEHPAAVEQRLFDQPLQNVRHASASNVVETPTGLRTVSEGDTSSTVS